MSTRKLSDYNAPGYRSLKTASPALFSDLNLSMPIHPNKKDITPLTDLDAIKQSVKNLVLTNYGEKLFRPRFGGDVTSKLFENVDRFTAVSIMNSITTILKKYEKRVTDVEVLVVPNSGETGYDVTITFRVVNTTDRVEVGFGLTRLR